MWTKKYILFDYWKKLVDVLLTKRKIILFIFKNI